jgi:serine/threonine-protein kinase
MTLVGRVFTNRYEIEREIARGGMAEVYLARDRLLDRPVALKALFPEYAREPSFVERFRREAQAAANLNHPNIVAIYDWGQESGTYFIVLEYVEGRSLRDLIRTEGPLEPHQAADVAAEIAAALAFAHRAGVVHRDVKPGNVLLTRSGGVKVTDFGIARAGAGDGLTQTGSVMGTATYFSPEQAQGLAVDGRSDVYSLGVVLYEMVTGVAPFAGDSPVAVAYKHVREDVVPPSQRNPDVPPALEQIVLTALAKDPDHRYQTADDLRADLLRFRRGRPLAAAPVTALVAEVPSAAVQAATGAYAGSATVQAPRLPPPPPGAPPPMGGPRRRGPFATVVTILVLVLVVAAIVLVAQLAGGDRPQVTVPDVTTLHLEEARAALEDEGFDVEVVREANEDVDEDIVFDQDPAGGDTAEEGSEVKIFVSAGSGTEEIPELEGVEVNEAQAVLEDLGFEVATETEANADIGAFRVIRTEPEAGEEVAVGETVTIIVSTGPPLVPVPDVDGRSEADASEALRAEGFAVRVEREPSSEVDEGLVIRTEPAGGDEARQGSEVVLVVSTGEERVEVPLVVGLTEEDANALLDGLGLSSRRIEQPSTSFNDGKVIAQDPPAGTEVDPGAEVVLTIGVFGATTTTGGATTTSP